MDPDASPTARALLALELIQGSPGITADRHRRQAGRVRAGRPALRRHPARGGHPDRVGPRAVRRLPRRPRPAAAAADVQRDRGARPGHGGARRPPRRRRPDQPGRQRAGQDRAGAARAGRRPGRGRAPGHRPGTRPRRRPARPADHHHTRAGLLGPPAGTPAGTAPRPARSGTPTSTRGRSSCATAAGTCCAGRTRRTAAALPDRPDPRRRGARRRLQPAGRTRPGRHARGASRGRLGVLRRGGHRRAVRHVAPCVPRTLGRLEPADADTCRLVGTTSNPWWYAEQLTTLPAAFRIVGGPECATPHAMLGQRLLAAAEEGPTPLSGRATPASPNMCRRSDLATRGGVAQECLGGGAELACAPDRGVVEGGVAGASPPSSRPPLVGTGTRRLSAGDALRAVPSRRRPTGAGSHSDRPASSGLVCGHPADDPGVDHAGLGWRGQRRVDRVEVVERVDELAREVQVQGDPTALEPVYQVEAGVGAGPGQGVDVAEPERPRGV